MPKADTDPKRLVCSGCRESFIFISIFAFVKYFEISEPRYNAPLNNYIEMYVN